MDRTNGQKISTNIDKLNTLSSDDLTNKELNNIFRTFHPTIAGYAFSPSACGT